ncbi:MAG: HAMP domain-containing sensor histidine kinase [Stappiaceae bacterium]
MMKRRLYLQVYMTIIGSLLIVVILSSLTWNLFGRDRMNPDMFEIVGNLTYLSLPSARATIAEQRAAVEELGHALKIDLTLFDEDRNLIGSSGKSSPSPEDTETVGRWQRTSAGRRWALHLPDGRWLTADLGQRANHRPLFGLVAFLCIVAIGVGVGAYPLVRRQMRRLEDLQRGVEKIGSGDLTARVDVQGRDEIASLAASFNNALSKIQKLVESHRMLLANASHELRTPLSRIRLGVEMLNEGEPDRRASLQQDIVELDELIDEILLMSRLDTVGQESLMDQVDLVALAAEEASRYPDCELRGMAEPVIGDARLLRRMIRNLLDNAYTHGALPVKVEIAQTSETVSMTVFDGGDGIADADCEKVFQPFYRGPGQQNVRGYGLGLALVQQIVKAHGGTVGILRKTELNSGIIVTLPVHPAQ